MNLWSIALAAMIFAAAATGKVTNPSDASSSITLSGAPVTTLHTPATP